MITSLLQYVQSHLKQVCLSAWFSLLMYPTHHPHFLTFYWYVSWWILLEEWFLRHERYYPECAHPPLTSCTCRRMELSLLLMFLFCLFFFQFCIFTILPYYGMLWYWCSYLPLILASINCILVLTEKSFHLKSLLSLEIFKHKPWIPPW